MEDELRGAVSGWVGLSVDRFTCSCEKIMRESHVDWDAEPRTHCASLPSCEIVIMILSLNVIEVISVGTPLTSPIVCLVRAGKGMSPWS